MKKLIQPFFAASFLLMATGLVPGVPFYIPIIGLLATALIGVMGVHILGSQDKEFDATIELMRLEVKRCAETHDLDVKKMEALTNTISKALSENRELAGRLR